MRSIISVSVIILLSVLQGCATFEKCGFSGCPGDAKVTADVEAQLRQYADLNLLHVQTLDNVVYLTGDVSTGLQRDHAEEVARQASDGARIVDSISVIQ
jgi:osmotically-inducible protein OsmY